ncbi:DNA repair exonuclease SbcCD ATPase subunit [Methylohalomonas lacus]|uniref:DNA repair exonuclease SbcCD ATPase subunit n=1 Tax=Methylohalomonas lacus TaxID=398773 RepID=A0AAE3L0I3_9GAMM|nr:DUF3450 domain-containing protein [Methylohalomonas lacus]MCS3902559.1 DNA repair exonuclease SbcCD ATPase subunit [Methylohalomonas lacus]
MWCQPRNYHLLYLLALPAVAPQAIAGPVEQAVGERVEVQEQAERSEQEVDQLADETETMEQEYRDTLRKIENAKSYNEQLRKQVEQQNQRLASFERQLNEVEETQRNIVPLMSRMIEVLDEMIEVDTPFLPREREARLSALKEMMYRPDVNLPDKFRRIMEAYQIEMDYGRNMEVYEGELERDNGDRLTVEFLRVGRVGLYYQTLDGQESGYWDDENNRWQTLSQDFNAAISKGLKIARKEAPPDFFRIPVPAPEQAE